MYAECTYIYQLVYKIHYTSSAAAVDYSNINTAAVKFCSLHVICRNNLKYVYSFLYSNSK